MKQLLLILCFFEIKASAQLTYWPDTSHWRKALNSKHPDTAIATDNAIIFRPPTAGTRVTITRLPNILVPFYCTDNLDTFFINTDKVKVIKIGNQYFNIERQVIITPAHL